MNRLPDEPFLKPPLYPIRMPLVQAMLTTRRPARVALLEQHTNAWIVDAGPDESPAQSGESVRLLAYYTPAQTQSNVGLRPAARAVSQDSSRGVVILLHGWEGNSHSVLNLVLGTALVEAGYEVIRLNLRDHGPTTCVDPRSLNEGMFLATLVGESRRAVAQLVEMVRPRPAFLIGASLGGNFALRIASTGADGDAPDLKRVIAISPVVNPAKTVDLLDASPPFQRYFRSRWLLSLQRKAAAFPQRYDVAGIEKIRMIRAMTEWMIQRYTPYESIDAYFSSYAYLRSAADALAVPTTIIASADDPVIPVADIHELTASPYLEQRIFSWGGHVGLIHWPPLRPMLPKIVLQILSAGA